MPVPDFSPGEVLTAAAMDSVGMWLVKTQTVGTAVSSVTVTGAFSADYDNYLITVVNGTMSVDTSLTLAMGSTATGYYGSLIYSSYNTTTIAAINDNNTTKFTYAGGGNNVAAYIEILQPYLANETQIRSRIRYSTTYGQYIGHLSNSTSYTSFVLSPFSGTMTGGTIRVYGYRN